MELAIVETKQRAADLVVELERRIAGEGLPALTVNINGCPNACARTQVADIGLKGQLVTDTHGHQVEGFQVHLGGALTMADTQDAAFGRKLRGLKTTAADLPGYVESLTRNYLAGRSSAEESFAAWAARAPESALTPT